MTVAIPVCANQVQRAIKLMNWCAQLDGGSRHPCLLVLAREIQDPDIQELLKAAGRAFCNISAVKAILRSKQNENETADMLLRTAEDYSKKVSKLPFFWLSVWSVPKSSGWLDKIESEKLALRPLLLPDMFHKDVDGTVIDGLLKRPEVKIEVQRPSWPSIQKLSGSEFKREPVITLVYIHVPGDEKHWRYAREFVDTYKKFPPGYQHETVIVCQGKGPAPLAKALFKPVLNPHYFLHDDSGWDIGGYIAVASMDVVGGSNCVVCLGGSAYLQASGWLKRIAEVWAKHGPGFYGATPTYEVSPHLCTSGFWTAPEILKAYPIKVVNRETRYDFEHGPNACWKMVAENGLPVKLVTWDGEYDWQDWRKPPNIYRRGDQSNALIHWHHYKEYEKADPKRKGVMSSHSDTLTDPQYLSDQNRVEFCPEIPPVSIARPVTTLKAGDSIIVRRTAAIGDVVAATSVGDELMRMGFKVEFQANHLLHSLLRMHPRLKHITSPSGTATINLDGAYETHPERTLLHFNEMFREQANKGLARYGISIQDCKNWTPRLAVPVKSRTVKRLARYPKPWVAICPRSNSWVQRTVPDSVWQDASRQFSGTKFWLGSHGPAPSGIVDCNCRSIDDLAAWVSDADLVVSVDSGPMHIAAAVGTPLVAILQSSSPELHLTDQRDFVMIAPPLDCLNCQKDACPINQAVPPCQNVSSEAIAQAVTLRLGSISGNSVAAIIAVYKPDIEKLNRCLDQVLPQVSEVVICGDLDTPWPIDGIHSDPKIKRVRKLQRGTGYGRKATFGARHSNSPLLHFLNDDVYLNGGVVKKLVSEMKPGVGIVTHTLRYLDGSIQYSGKFRPSGARAFGHVDLKAKQSRYRGLVEQESACGASMMVRRRAFFDANGFDEKYLLYSEDDDLAMKIRQNGQRVFLTTEAEGTHEEHASTSITPRWNETMRKSSEIFSNKWAFYFKANPNPNVIGRFP